MRKILVLGMAASLMVSCASQKSKADVKLEDFESKVSYMVGQDIGNTLKSMGSDFDLEILARAIEDVMNDRPSRLSDEELKEVGAQFQQQLQQKQMAMQEEMSEKNKEAGDAFLEENKTNPDVVVTESGLQYKVITQGEGPSPSEEDIVTVHYTGRLLDGTVFDSSHERGTPATFNLSQVIPGWTEGVQLMNVGSKFELYLPSDLAYGPRGAGQDIEPNSTLVFEIELLDIE